MNFRLITLIAMYASSAQLHANSTVSVYNSMPGLDCVINPSLVVDIASPVSGVLEYLYVERSQQVTAGQELAQLESNVDRATVELAKYRAGITSGVGLGTVNVKFDELRKQRVDGLIDDENVSKEIVDQVERDVQLSNWNLKEAKEQARIRELELQTAEELLKQKTLTAPFGGFVLDTFKNQGEFVSDQAILRLAQLDPLVIEAIVPMEHFGLIKPGMYADVMPEVVTDKKVVGKVVAVDRIGDTASNTFGVKLSMSNPNYQIPAGQKCVLKFNEMSFEHYDDITSRNTDRSQKSLLADSEDNLAENIDSQNTISDDTPVLAAALPVSSEKTASSQTPESTVSDIPVLAAATREAPSSYIVLIEQPETDEATKELTDRLIDAGVYDFVKFKSSTDQQLISLGVFTERAKAETRQAALDQLGFATMTAELFD